jgi:hypothetical protein
MMHTAGRRRGEVSYVMAQPYEGHMVADLEDSRRRDVDCILGERHMLEAWLGFRRVTLLAKCDGLDDGSRKARPGQGFHRRTVRVGRPYMDAEPRFEKHKRLQGVWPLSGKSKGTR